AATRRNTRRRSHPTIPVLLRGLCSFPSRARNSAVLRFVSVRCLPPATPQFTTLRDLNRSRRFRRKSSRGVPVTPITQAMSVSRPGGLPMGGGGRVGAVAIVMILLGGVGCVHTDHHVGPTDMATAVTIPPPGAVPRELDKITLPPYVIEAPDQLLIEVVQRSRVPDPDDPDKKRMKWATDRVPVQPISG